LRLFEVLNSSVVAHLEKTKQRFPPERSLPMQNRKVVKTPNMLR
jgi:hypothetical protein